jgi:arylsulfatase A-like enzyme
MKRLSRFDLLKFACAGAVNLAFFARLQTLAEPLDKPPAQHAQPNFIIILADDMGYGDIEPFGSKLNRTPNLNRMAAEGMKLTSFYGAPVCTPSRAQLMTGCYSKRISLPAVLTPRSQVGLSPKELTIADLLKKHDYSTMLIGKWHLGDQPPFLPTRHGFDHYLGLPYSNDHKPLVLMRDETVIEAPPALNELTARYTDEAVQYITANRNHPFFLYLAHAAIHVPISPGKEFEGKSANGRLGDWIEETDWSVGRVLDTLKALKLDANTVVLFTSDNGGWREQGKDGGDNGPLRGGKRSTYEGGLREPALVWWPGKVPAGAVSDAITSEMDILPTFVKLAGGSVPADRKIDGLDLWPLLSGTTKESPRKTLFYYRDVRGQGKIEAVRSGVWKLSVAPQAEGWVDLSPEILSAPYKPRLFNLDQDIGETTDVAAQHPEVVRELQADVAEMEGDLGKGIQLGPGVRPPGFVKNPKFLTEQQQAELPPEHIAIEYD